jgi:Family of unknown function (DUF6049)
LRVINSGDGGDADSERALVPLTSPTAARHVVAAVFLASALAFAAPLSAGAAGAAPSEVASAGVPALGVAPVEIAVVVPFTVPIEPTGLIPTDTLATYTAPDGLLTHELDAVAGTPAAIGLDPMILASIRALGTAAPLSAQEWLARLGAVSNDVFLLGYADADPASVLTAGSVNDLVPLGFGFAIDASAFGPAVTPSPTPTDGTTPVATPTSIPGGPPPLPTTADLLAWSSALPAIAWPADGTVTAKSLDRLADADYEDVILSASNVSASSEAVVGLNDIAGVVADAPTTELVREAAFASTSSALLDALDRLGTALDAAEAVSPGRTLVATLDRNWPIGASHLQQVLASIDARASAQLVPLRTVLSGPKADAKLAEPSDNDRAARQNRLVSAAAAEETFARIAEDPLAITAPRRLALLSLFSVAWANDPAWDTASSAFLAASHKLLASVQIVRSSDVLLLSDRSDLPITVSNALSVPVTVYITVRPLRPLLHVENTTVAITVEPESSEKAKIPVQSISNGEVNVRVSLADQVGQPIGTARFVKVILRAGWETAGTLIAVILVVLVFGGGLARNIVKRRAAARTKAADGASAP